MFRFGQPFPDAMVGCVGIDHLMRLPPKDIDILALGVSPEDLTAYGYITNKPQDNPSGISLPHRW